MKFCYGVAFILSFTCSTFVYNKQSIWSFIHDLQSVSSKTSMHAYFKQMRNVNHRKFVTVSVFQYIYLRRYAQCHLFVSQTIWIEYIFENENQTNSNVYSNLNSRNVKNLRKWLTNTLYQTKIYTKSTNVHYVSNARIVNWYVYCKLSNFNFPSWIFFPQNDSEKVCWAPYQHNSLRKKKKTKFAMKAQWIMKNIALLKTAHNEKSIRARKRAAVYRTYKLLSNISRDIERVYHIFVENFLVHDVLLLIKLGFFL